MDPCVVAQRVLEHRHSLIAEFFPQSVRAEALRRADELVEMANAGLLNLSPAKQRFMADLMVAASRIWEAFSRDPTTGVARFPTWVSGRDSVVLTMLKYDAAMVWAAYDRAEVEPYPLEQLQASAASAKEQLLGQVSVSNPRSSTILLTLCMLFVYPTRASVPAFFPHCICAACSLQW